MQLEAWAMKWGVPRAALDDLRVDVLGIDMAAPRVTGMSESSVQQRVRLANAKLGVHLWRNNVGVLEDKRGVPVRYGLANDSKAVNQVLKSGDLIGIRKTLITPAMVGSHIGQFVSRECKRQGWRYSDDAHERAQQNWANLINKLGGDAKFTTGEP